MKKRLGITDVNFKNWILQKRLKTLLITLVKREHNVIFQKEKKIMSYFIWPECVFEIL